MDFGMATFDNASVLSHEEKSKPINNHGSDDHKHFLQTSKSSRTDYFDHPSKTMSMRSDSSLSASDANNMLSFSSSSANTTKDGNQNSLFSFYQPPPVYIKNTGYGYGGLQTGMHMPISRYKGPFTPSQWMELEQQALIYKHFVANVPVPSNMLNPLRKSLNTFIFPGSSSSTSYAPNSYGWGAFHLRFSGTNDPEPGRCRRTDGKKWRCSRDAVPDQKYCERHINRGRHRSRKPVESQNGQAVSGPTASKVSPVVTSASVPASSTHTPINRTQEPAQALMFGPNYSSFVDRGACSPNPVPNFTDGWSKDEPVKQDWTRLSMSIPVACSDFSSSSNSPTKEKLAVPPLGLTGEFERDLDTDSTHKQAVNWIPISWGDTMGGPLGEVLNRTCSSSDMKGKKSPSGSETNQMWDAVSCDTRSGCSPTRVLQKTTFVSLSSSSSGSPKGNKKEELVLSTLAS